MKDIKVLGSGCSKCLKTAGIITRIANEMGVEVTVAKVSDAETIMRYGVMSTPAVVIDETLVHTGSVPLPEQVSGWLS